MKCRYCGHEMREGARFCSQCGGRVEEPGRKVCPSCGRKGEQGMLFCEYCGTRLVEEETRESCVKPVPAPLPEPAPLPKPGPSHSGRFLMEMKLMSYYKGEPVLGIAKSTGTVKIFDDRLEFHKVMGNSAASMLGPVPMLLAAKQARDGGSVDTYWYRDISSAREGRYGGVYHTIVLSMKDGQVHTFAGTLNSGKIQEAVVQISRNLI